MDETLANFGAFYKNGHVLTTDVTLFRFYTKEKNFFWGYKRDTNYPFILYNNFNVQSKKTGEKIAQLYDRLYIKDYNMRIQVHRERTTKCIIQTGKAKKKYVSIVELDTTKLLPTV